MRELTPSEAAQLADRIYDVQNPDIVERFAQLPFFKKNLPGVVKYFVTTQLSRFL